MNSHNAKPEFSFHKTPVTDDTAKEEAKLISAKLTGEADLTIDEDLDTGCDPYNATGQHLMLKLKNSRRA